MFLINSRQDIIRCGRSLSQPAGLIPKLRPLFCRVPWGAITRSPWSSRPDYLYRFYGTVLYILSLEVFLGSVLLFVYKTRGLISCLLIESMCPDFPKALFSRQQSKSNNTQKVQHSVTPSHIYKVMEY